MIELKAYLGVLIYRSLYPQPKRKGYWNVSIQKPIHKGLTDCISRNRFEQLEANIHISDPNKKGDCFSKLEPLNSQLLKTSKALWHPSSDLAVDECMCRFIGRTKVKLTIPTKLISTGIKAWIIADKGYFLY